MDYSIDFASLELGEYRFDFKIDESLFQEFGNQDILGADISLSVDLLKEERVLTLTLDFKGMINLLCDRCLDPLELKVSGIKTLFIKFGEENTQEIDNIIFISDRENEIDLSQQIYEYILLQKPMKCVHEISECNSDIIDILTTTTTREDNNKSIDPRWDALRNIKLD